ncbi:MAG: SDR family oxidoreductase [Actinobacteria bacterium]|nr:SDR family oxidoreductase [Actinomycetota bacterium]
MVAGSTGYLGQHLVRELHGRGHQVRALVRSPDKLDPIRDAVDETHRADATDPDALAGCCEGADVVFSSIGLMGKSSKLTCWQVDFAANRNLLEEARRAGVKKFIYTSVVRAPGLDKLELVRAKRAFEEALKGSDMPRTILYPNGFFSDMDEFLAMARKGRAYLFGSGNFRINPIDGADVAAAAAAALTGNDEAVELGGPDIFTHEEIAQQAFRAAGNPPRITHVPLWTVKAGLTLLRRLTPLRTHQLIEFPLTVLTQDVLAPATGRSHLAEYFQQAVSAAAPQPERQ